MLIIGSIAVLVCQSGFRLLKRLIVAESLELSGYL